MSEAPSLATFAGALEYGVAYHEGVQSRTLANMNQIVDQFAMVLSGDFLPKSDLVWGVLELHNA